MKTNISVSSHRGISETYQWEEGEIMNSESLQAEDKRKSAERVRHDPAFVCNLCGDGKDLQTISPGGKRERENNLIQEIPRQTKTELPK